MTDLNLSMKLLIDPKGGRVLFAEAGKDVVDFLLSILSLPLGFFAKLQNRNDKVSSIANLYRSVDVLRDLRMIRNKNIDNLLNTSVKVTDPPAAADLPIMLVTTGQSSPTNKSSCSFEGGFVKKYVTYMIMDDLVVKPMSTISSITLFKRLNLKEVDALEEKKVNLTIDEVRNLMIESLKTKNVLTKVFCKEKVVVEEEKKSLESVE